MLAIKMKQKDGFEILDEAENLEQAIQFVEDEAVTIAENNWTGDWDKIFPIFWSVIDADSREKIASGFVDETGEIVSNQEG